MDWLNALIAKGPWLLYIAKGMGLTLALLGAGLTTGLVLGSLLCWARYSGHGVYPIRAFVSIIRGTPVILQLSFVYFALPSLIGIPIDAAFAGALTLGLNSAAYTSEILRAGLMSVPQGQFEAARTLGIPAAHMWRHIIAPQVLRACFPAMVSELITLLKETALVATIGGMDVMRRAQLVAAEQFTYFAPLCVAGLYYYVLILSIEYASEKIERSFKK